MALLFSGKNAINPWMEQTVFRIMLGKEEPVDHTGNTTHLRGGAGGGRRCRSNLVQVVSIQYAASRKSRFSSSTLSNNTDIHSLVLSDGKTKMSAVLSYAVRKAVAASTTSQWPIRSGCIARIDDWTVTTVENIVVNNENATTTTTTTTKATMTTPTMTVCLFVAGAIASVGGYDMNIFGDPKDIHECVGVRRAYDGIDHGLLRRRFRTSLLEHLKLSVESDDDEEHQQRHQLHDNNGDLFSAAILNTIQQNWIMCRVGFVPLSTITSNDENVRRGQHVNDGVVVDTYGDRTIAHHHYWPCLWFNDKEQMFDMLKKRRFLQRWPRQHNYDCQDVVAISTNELEEKIRRDLQHSSYRRIGAIDNTTTKRDDDIVVGCLLFRSGGIGDGNNDVVDDNSMPVQSRRRRSQDLTTNAFYCERSRILPFVTYYHDFIIGQKLPNDEKNVVSTAPLFVRAVARTLSILRHLNDQYISQGNMRALLDSSKTLGLPVEQVLLQGVEGRYQDVQQPQPPSANTVQFDSEQGVAGAERRRKRFRKNCQTGSKSKTHANPYLRKKLSGSSNSANSVCTPQLEVHSQPRHCRKLSNIRSDVAAPASLLQQHADRMTQHSSDTDDDDDDGMEMGISSMLMSQEENRSLVSMTNLSRDIANTGSEDGATEPNHLATQSSQSKHGLTDECSGTSKSSVNLDATEFTGHVSGRDDSDSFTSALETQQQSLILESEVKTAAFGKVSRNSQGLQETSVTFQSVAPTAELSHRENKCESAMDNWRRIVADRKSRKGRKLAQTAYERHGERQWPGDRVRSLLDTFTSSKR